MITHLFVPTLVAWHVKWQSDMDIHIIQSLFRPSLKDIYIVFLFFLCSYIHCYDSINYTSSIGAADADQGTANIIP